MRTSEEKARHGRRPQHRPARLGVELKPGTVAAHGSSGNVDGNEQRSSGRPQATGVRLWRAHALEGAIEGAPGEVDHAKYSVGSGCEKDLLQRGEGRVHRQARN